MQALFKWSAEEVSQIQQIEFDHFCSSSCHGVEILQCISFHYNSHFCKALVIIKTLQKKKERGEWGNIQFSIVLVVSNGRPWHPRLSGGGRVRVRLRHMGANADSIRKPGKYKKFLKNFFHFSKFTSIPIGQCRCCGSGGWRRRSVSKFLCVELSLCCLYVAKRYFVDSSVLDRVPNLFLILGGSFLAMGVAGIVMLRFLKQFTCFPIKRGRTRQTVNRLTVDPYSQLNLLDRL